MFRLHHETEDAFHVQRPSGEIAAIPKQGTPKHVLVAVRALPHVETLSEGGIAGPPNPGQQPPPQLRQAEEAAKGDDAPVKMAEGGTAPEDAAAPNLIGDPQFDAMNAEVARSQAAPPAPAPIPAGPNLMSVRGSGDAPFTPTAASASPAPGGPEAAALRGKLGLVDPATLPGVAPDASGAPGTGGAVPGTPGAAAYAASGASMPSIALPNLPGYPSGPLESKMKQMEATGREGAQLEAQAESQKAAEMTTAYEGYQKSLADLQSKWQADRAQVTQEYANAIDDAKNARIDPSRLWSSKGGAEKASALVGIVLGGIGSGLTGQPNAALQVVERAIDRDVEAQRAEMGQKNNLVSMLYQKLGNVDAAAAAARMYLGADIAAKAGLAAARSGSVEAQAKAKLLESELQGRVLGPMAQIVNGKYQAALTQAQMAWQQRMFQYQMQLAAGSGQDERGYVPSTATRPMVSDVSIKGIADRNKDANERRVDLNALGPGAHTYAKTPEQAKDVRNALADYDEMERNLGVMGRVARENPVGINTWGAKAREEFNVAHGAANLAMNRLMKQQRFTGEENGIYGTMLASPTKFLTGAGQANLDALRALVQRKRMEEYQGQLGIDPRLFAPRSFTPAGG